MELLFLDLWYFTISVAWLNTADLLTLNSSNAPAHDNASIVFLLITEVLFLFIKSFRSLKLPFSFLSLYKSFIDSIPTFLIAPSAYKIESLFLKKFGPE